MLMRSHPKSSVSLSSQIAAQSQSKACDTFFYLFIFFPRDWLFQLRGFKSTVWVFSYSIFSRFIHCWSNGRSQAGTLQRCFVNVRLQEVFSPQHLCKWITGFAPILSLYCLAWHTAACTCKYCLRHTCFCTYWGADAYHEASMSVCLFFASLLNCSSDQLHPLWCQQDVKSAVMSKTAECLSHSSGYL